MSFADGLAHERADRQADEETRLASVIERVQYKAGSGFEVTRNGDCLFVQHYQHVVCITNGSTGRQKGRKFYISPHMTTGEIERTLFLAVKQFESHEINETFLLDGERFLNPHPEGPRPTLEEIA